MSKYEENKAAKVGTEIICPKCGKHFVKKQYSQAFCCGQCKDKYLNTMGDRHKGPEEDVKKDYELNGIPATAVGKVFTNTDPKLLTVDSDEWQSVLGQFDNGQRVRIILVKEDAE